MSNEQDSNGSQSSPARISVYAAADSQPPSPFRTLIAFPFEIRQLIYPHALAASAALTRISKAIHAETQPLLHQYGIHRIHIDIKHEPWPLHWYSKDMFWYRERPYVTIRHLGFSSTTFPDPIAAIQNFEIHIDVPEPKESDHDRSGCLRYPRWHMKNFTVRDNPGYYFKWITERISSTALEPKRCLIQFTFGQCYELFNEEGCMEGLCPSLANFEDLEIVLCERPWVHKYPFYFAADFKGKGIEFGTARSVNQAVGLFKEYLEKRIGGGKKTRIVRSSVDTSREVEVLWSNYVD